MKALILAAGLGSRLAPLTDTVPKSMVPVNGKPILIKQIENLIVNGIEDITIISGYKADIIEKEIHSKWPQIQILRNDHFQSTNNMCSAYLAKKMFAGHAFLMMNADVFFDASIIKELLSIEAQDAIVTDIGRYLEESMKVAEKNGRLVHISKTISEQEALGTSIDVYKFSKDGGEKFFRKCAEFIDNEGKTNLWSEVALDAILSDVEFHACKLNGKWYEIDTVQDLREAELLFPK